MLGTIEVHDKQRKSKAENEGEDDESDDQARTAGGKATAAGGNVQQARDTAPKHGEQAERKSKSGKPAATGSAPATSIKAPTFNKPKPAAQPVPAPSAAPETGTMAKPFIGDDDDAEYFLDPQDSASPAAINCEREQQQLAVAAKQARKANAQKSAVEKLAAVPVTDKATAQNPSSRTAIIASTVRSLDNGRALLSQPVGGRHRLLLQAEQVPAGKSVGTNQSEPIMPKHENGTSDAKNAAPADLKLCYNATHLGISGVDVKFSIIWTIFQRAMVGRWPIF
jgi:hypothetical protein